jgi:hypothetical protein
VIAYNKGVATVTFVEKSIDVNCVKSGDELIAINDKKVYCWLDQLSKYQGAETKLQEYNNVIVKFNWLLLLEIGEQNTFDLTVSDSNGIHKNVSVPAIVWTGKNEWKGMQSAANKNEKNAAPFSYSMHMDAKVCLFKAKTFYRLQDNLQGKSTLLAEFESVMNKVFSECKQKNTEVLIFDIRDNSGGNGSMPYKFLRCAANKPYKEGAKSWRYSAAYKKANLICGLMYYKVPAFLHLENVLKLEWFWDPYLPEKHDGEYYVGDSNGLQKPYTCWKGTLVILVDRQTASAAKDAAVIVKDNHLGYIAGEETGGSASEATEVCHIFLPNSGIDCQIPSAYYLRPAGYDDGRGVLPDIELDLKKPDDVLIIQIYQDLQNRNQKH